ncbi:MAG: DNA mismatch repair protein MutT [Salinivirgaceae bacterium]
MTVRKLMQSISVDCVILGFDSEQLNVILVDRTLILPNTTEVVFSDLTLTGYHIYENEDLDSAAARIVKDLTGLENLPLKQFYSFGALDRLHHPNDQLWLENCGDVFSDRVVTIGYYSLLPSTNVNIIQKGRNAAWYPVTNAKGLAYDHDFVVEKAIEHLRYKFWHEPIGFELLPVKFTLSQMQKLYEAILGTQFDKRNFRKKVSQMNYVVPLKEKQIGVAHKPAQLFMFSRDVYDKTRKERFDFFV